MTPPGKPTAGEVSQRARENDAVWARFYRDGADLAQIAAEFGGSIYDYSPWLYRPLLREDARAHLDRDAVLEEAAQIADEHARRAWEIGHAQGQSGVCSSGRNYGARDVAAAIRKRKSGSDTIAQEKNDG